MTEYTNDFDIDPELLEKIIIEFFKILNEHLHDNYLYDSAFDMYYEIDTELIDILNDTYNIYDKTKQTFILIFFI